MQCKYAGQINDSYPRAQKEGTRFHYATLIGKQLKSFDWFISRIFHWRFLDHGSPKVTEISGKGGTTEVFTSSCHFLFLEPLFFSF